MEMCSIYTYKQRNPHWSIHCVQANVVSIAAIFSSSWSCLCHEWGSFDVNISSSRRERTANFNSAPSFLGSHQCVCTQTFLLSFEETFWHTYADVHCAAESEELAPRVTLKKEEENNNHSLTELLTWKVFSDTVVINISRRTLAVIPPPRSSWALVYLLAISCFPARGSGSFPALSFL